MSAVEIAVGGGTAVVRDLTPEERAAADARAARARAEQEAETAAGATRAAARVLVAQTAQSAVGVRFDQLTAAQVRALAAILFWQAGALDADGIVQPLAGWVGA